MSKETEQKELDKHLKLMAKSSVLVFLGAIFSKLFTYLYRTIIARHFGPEIYGLFSLGLMISILVMAIASLGLLDGTVRFVSFYRGKGDKKRIKYLLKITSAFLLATSFISAILMYFFSGWIAINFFNNPGLAIFIKIFGILTPFTIFFYFFLSIIQAYEKITTYTIILDFLENIFKVFFLVFLIFIGLNTNAVIFSYALGLIAVCLIAFFYIKYNISEIFNAPNLEKNDKKDLEKQLFSYSWPLIFSVMITGILAYIDSFIIGSFMKNGAYMVGIYNAAIPIASLMTIASGLFARLFLPMITKEFSNKNLDIVKELSKQTQKWILIINMPALVLILLFPGAFINLLFGSEYLAAENALRFLAVAYFFVSMSLTSNSIITMAGKSKTTLINILFVTLLNFVLDIFLIDKYGINGVAFATMICNIILFLLLTFEANYFSSIIPLRRKMLGVIFSVIPPTLALLYVRKFLVSNPWIIILQIV